MCRLQTGGEVLMHVDGPYGEATSHPVWLKHPILIIFAGGIGVSSFFPQLDVSVVFTAASSCTYVKWLS